MVKRKMVKNVLIVPGRMSFIIFASAIWVSVSDFGPDASNHVWSNLVAADCPKVKLAFGDSRCISEGKYPNILENRCVAAGGEDLAGPLAFAASSMATRSPIMVTIRADSFKVSGIVITGVF